MDGWMGLIVLLHVIERTRILWGLPVFWWGRYRRECGSTPWSILRHTSTGTWRRGPVGWHPVRGFWSACRTPPAAGTTLPCSDNGPPQRRSCVTLRTSSSLHQHSWSSVTSGHKCVMSVMNASHSQEISVTLWVSECIVLKFCQSSMCAP